jgi:glyoxylase-like metal-dependent hydrolase (beta-lactamase superfamily II)
VIEYTLTVKETDRRRCGRPGMILRQFLHTDPVAISYLFGCGGHAACAVVDPVGDIAPYLRVADNTGMRIRFVIDTHIHADHRSAGRALAREAGAEYVLYAGAEVGFPFHAAKDGDRLPLARRRRRDGRNMTVTAGNPLEQPLTGLGICADRQFGITRRGLRPADKLRKVVDIGET